MTAALYIAAAVAVLLVWPFVAFHLLVVAYCVAFTNPVRWGALSRIGRVRGIFEFEKVNRVLMWTGYRLWSHEGDRVGVWWMGVPGSTAWRHELPRGHRWRPRIGAPTGLLIRESQEAKP